MVGDSAESPPRWTAKRRTTLVRSILKGETPPQAAGRKHGLTVAEVEEWRDRFLLGAENALRARPKDEERVSAKGNHAWLPGWRDPPDQRSRARKMSGRRLLGLRSRAAWKLPW